MSLSFSVRQYFLKFYNYFKFSFFQLRYISYFCASVAFSELQKILNERMFYFIIIEETKENQFDISFQHFCKYHPMEKILKGERII